MLKAFLVAITFVSVTVDGKADAYLWRDNQGVSRLSEAPPREGARDVRKLKTTLKLFATSGTGQFKSDTGDGTSNDGVW